MCECFAVMSICVFRASHLWPVGARSGCLLCSLDMTLEIFGSAPVQQGILSSPPDWSRPFLQETLRAFEQTVACREHCPGAGVPTGPGCFQPDTHCAHHHPEPLCLLLCLPDLMHRLLTHPFVSVTRKRKTAGYNEV